MTRRVPDPPPDTFRVWCTRGTTEVCYWLPNDPSKRRARIEFDGLVVEALVGRRDHQAALAEVAVEFTIPAAARMLQRLKWASIIERLAREVAVASGEWGTRPPPDR
jgi:hypothetical protein